MKEHFDNAEFVCTGTHLSTLTAALKLCFDIMGNSTTECFLIEKPKSYQECLADFGDVSQCVGFFPLWRLEEGATPFPAPLFAEEVAPLVLRWLDYQKYGGSPDCDGSATKGWKITTRYSNGCPSQICGIIPYWALAGK